MLLKNLTFLLLAPSVLAVRTKYAALLFKRYRELNFGYSASP